ncbi:uncharacterized protein LOC119833767 [Zerene cesonia]|uniref:uncharacterized protein LOC119833767 n=1 Tax=Zerene cesonia TaxID=33412 RepID=UPI0018E51A86|nr:uncharacterized protein LOC119833767 [Zerene cesonia]
MSLFGEIVEPGTRSSWEDWDDAAVENDTPELKWPNNLNIPDTIDLFIIFDGKRISEAVKLQSQDSLELVATVREACLQLYKIKLRNAFICVLKDYSLLLTTDIVELLREFLEKSNEVLVLVNKPITDYHTNTESCQSCLVRSMCTTIGPDNRDGLNFSKLEQPNIISGVAAGVVTLREHLDLPAKVVIYYIEYSENYQMAGLYNYLQKLDVSIVTHTVPNNIINSNLYI